MLLYCTCNEVFTRKWIFSFLLQEYRGDMGILPTRYTSTFSVICAHQAAQDQVVYRGAQTHLYGRWHIDYKNAMMFGEYGLDGVLEQARVSGLGVQEMARKSPGAGITAMQILTALHARFGKIESHDAVTSMSRELLLQAKEVADEQGYLVIHMYVDCLFVQKHGCQKAADFTPLLDAIAAQTGIPIALDGVYRWVARTNRNPRPIAGDFLFLLQARAQRVDQCLFLLRVQFRIGMEDGVLDGGHFTALDIFHQLVKFSRVLVPFGEIDTLPAIDHIPFD